MTARSSAWPAAFLAIRSVLWTLLVPGVVAGYVPWRFFGLGRARLAPFGPLQLLGMLCAGAGVVLLAACIWEFARSGRGTLLPADAPRHLVVRGPYRYLRNPMYLGVTAILLGEALWAGSATLLLYWAAWFAVVNVFVVFYEERALRRRFGAEYEEYRRQVRRWIPRLNR